MHNSIEQAFDDLLTWCRKHDFAGADPFDALNSRLFQSTPLTDSRTARLIWTQLIKRSPLNLRSLAFVPEQKNPKGIALFALAALATYRRLKTSGAEKNARDLLDQLMQMQIKGYSGAAWGYNFDWQSRNFFAPVGTPTIVPTAFAARALIEAFTIFNDDRYIQVARSSGDFILMDLKRPIDSEHELCFSYSPFDSTQIFNASLLAAETLASVAALSGESRYCEIAIRAAQYVIRKQKADGSWAYGAGPGQTWVDNFHTAYVLLSLFKILKACPDGELELRPALQRGYAFWRERFFLADGWPKYYHDTLYPADAHSAATAIITLIELQELDREAVSFAEKIAAWAIRNLHDPRGFFYYQRRHFYTVRTPFMRWTEAWMIYALARLLEERAL